MGKPFTAQHQNAVGNGLSRQAGAGGAKGQRMRATARAVQYQTQVVFGFNHNDHFGNHAVKTGIGAIREPAQLVGNDLALGQSAAQRLNQALHYAFVAADILCRNGQSLGMVRHSLSPFVFFGNVVLPVFSDFNGTKSHCQEFSI